MTIHHDEITAFSNTTEEAIHHYEEHIKRLNEESDRLKSIVEILRDLMNYPLRGSTTKPAPATSEQAYQESFGNA